MDVLNNRTLHAQVQAVRPAAQHRNVVKDGFGNEIEAEISMEMQAHLAKLAENELPEEIPDLASGLDNEAVPENPGQGFKML